MQLTSDFGIWQEGLVWLGKHFFEIFGTLFGLIYIVYSILGDRKLWFYGLVTSAIYVYICFSSRIYADMVINAYYVTVSVYGWIHWKLRAGKEKSNKMPISKVTITQTLLLGITTLVLCSAIFLVLNNLTDSDIALLDSVTTSASIVATWMLARKIMEHWLIWVVVDALSVGLYIYKELYLTAFLFLIYTIMAVAGFVQWRKQWINQTSA